MVFFIFRKRERPVFKLRRPERRAKDVVGSEESGNRGGGKWVCVEEFGFVVFYHGRKDILEVSICKLALFQLPAIYIYIYIKRPFQLFELASARVVKGTPCWNAVFIRTLYMRSFLVFKNNKHFMDPGSGRHSHHLPLDYWIMKGGYSPLSWSVIKLVG